MLRECLLSILEQSFVDFEIVVGNDYVYKQLTNENIGIQDSRVHIVNNRNNFGEINNMNSLLAMSSGKYFTWLADDDMYTINFLSAINDALIMYNYPECVFTSYSHGDTMSEKVVEYAGRLNFIDGRQFLQRYLSKKYKTLGCYGVFNTKYLRRIGGMKQLGTGFSPYSDNLLAIQVGSLDKVVYIDAPLIFFRTHEQSISYSSGDIEAYVSAQKALLKNCISLFHSEGSKFNYYQNIFLLIDLFISDFFCVLRRSRKLQPHNLIKYLVFVINHLKLLKNYKCKIVVRLLKNLVKHLLFLIVPIGKWKKYSHS
jgi:glycosyltransferase involved in cell wall biosynthesis